MLDIAFVNYLNWGRKSVAASQINHLNDKKILP